MSSNSLMQVEDRFRKTNHSSPEAQAKQTGRGLEPPVPSRSESFSNGNSESVHPALQRPAEPQVAAAASPCHACSLPHLGEARCTSGVSRREACASCRERSARGSCRLFYCLRFLLHSLGPAPVSPFISLLNSDMTSLLPPKYFFN